MSAELLLFSLHLQDDMCEKKKEKACRFSPLKTNKLVERQVFKKHCEGESCHCG